MGFFEKLFGTPNSKVPSSKPDDKNPVFNIEEVKEKLTPFRRTAYIPVTKQGENQFSIRSKMGGYPYLRNESDWPVCPNCKRHMQLFLQLNMSEIPEKKEEGLIQLFYCTNWDSECESVSEGYSAFSENSVCRKILISGDSATIKPNNEELFPEKEVISWQAKDDYPGCDEYEQLKINLDFFNDDVYEFLEKSEMLPMAGDKLFGWPHWIQNIEYPFDRKTETQMELLFQIDSEVNLPYMFGDSGIGHLTHSPDDQNELAFAWACC